MTGLNAESCLVSGWEYINKVYIENIQLKNVTKIKSYSGAFFFYFFYKLRNWFKFTIDYK